MVDLLAHAAGKAHNITGAVINHHDAGLQLGRAGGGGDLSQVGVDLVDLGLHIHVQGGVDVVAALLDLHVVELLGFLVQGIIVNAVHGSHIPGHVLQKGIHKPGIDLLREIVADLVFSAADRAEISTGFGLGIGANSALIAAGFLVADLPLVLGGNALLEHNLLGNGFLIFLLGNKALFLHLAQDVSLAVQVPVHTHSHALIPELIGALGIGVIQGGVVGDADEGGALSHSQALKLLAEVFLRSGLDTVAAPAEINGI